MSTALALFVFQSSVDVSEYNLLALLYQVAHQQPYVPPEKPDPPAEPPKQTATLTGQLQGQEMITKMSSPVKAW